MLFGGIVPVKKPGPGEATDPTVVARKVTPFRKVIDSESPSDALNRKEDEMSKNLSTQSGLPVVHARAAGIDIG